MDMVPVNFIDSVVGLFRQETLDQLAQEVRHPLWKDVVDLHHRNRVTYRIVFRITDCGIQNIFSAVKTFDIHNFLPDAPASVQTIREKGRFARIVEVSDETANRFPLYKWEDIKPLGEPETVKLLESIAPLMDHGLLNLLQGSPESHKVLLTLLHKRVLLRQISSLRYCGKIANDFLEHQIENSPLLSNVELMGTGWPDYTLDLLATFCSKRRSGRRVSVYLHSQEPTPINTNYIENLLDLWKRDGSLQFELYSSGRMDDEEFEALMDQGQVTEEHTIWRQSFFKHDTEKSLAILSNRSYLMQCYTCECDKFEKCLLKEVTTASGCPELHDF
uniref:F-box domain-containing protein n=1 Tax=Steinernema glaseri TaxID=37863 RepID=A0A1I7Y4T5_9BILA